MNKKIIIGVCVAVCSCKGFKQHDSASNAAGNGSDSVYATETAEPIKPMTIHISDNMVPLYDTLSLDNIIESVKYVPLSTDEHSLVDAGRVYKIDGEYVIGGGNYFAPYIKIFGDNGNYIGEAYTVGRGPNELPMVYELSFDYKRNRISILGLGKLLFHDIDIKKTNSITMEDYNNFSNLSWLKNGDLVSCVMYNSKSVFTSNKEESDRYPILFFLDSALIATDTIFEERPVHRLIEGVTVGPRLLDLLISNGGNVLYKSMVNDTVFRINDDHTLMPSFILDIPENLKPTIKNSEMDPLAKKNNMIYISYFFESQDYIFVCYKYQGLTYSGIWEKKSGNLLYYLRNWNMNNYLVSLDNIVTELPTGQIEWETNTILSSIPAEKLVGILPDIKPDDNPVVVELKLKSR